MTAYRCINVRLLILLAVFTMISGTMFAQNIVTGTITDENGEPLPGVAVTTTVNGKVIGTATDESGHYSLSVPQGSVLEISSIGYETMKQIVGQSSQISVALKEDSRLLDETVVIGYGTVKKKDILGSISTVRGNDLTDRGSGNVISSMRGKVSGVKITSGGKPGSNASIRIRGLGSFSSNSPLYIVDGSYGGSELGLNVEDIESIQVLKDASSAAIYGSRAANGVVIITTKKGKQGGLKVTFDSQLTVNWLPRYDLMDAETYKKYDDRAYAEAMLAGVDGVTSYQNHYENDTDWQDEMLRTGLLQKYNLALSGGSEVLNYYVSMNRLDNKGALEYTGYDHYGFRVNTSGKKGIFSYGENLFYTKSSRKDLNGSPWSNFISMPPTIGVYDSEHVGGWGYGDQSRANTYALNPVAMQEIKSSKNKEEYLYGNIYGAINLFNYVEAKLNVSYKSYNGTTDSLRKKGNWTMGQGDDSASLSYSCASHTDILIEQTYTFDHMFGKHHVNAVAGMTYDKFHEEQRWITKLDPLTVGDKYIASMDSATGTTTAGGSYSESVLISYLGRVNYSYDDRYLLQLTARRDGTSKLPKDGRWGNFASASLGWRISGEKFFNVRWIDDLKLRANYGTLGGSNIGYWDYQSTINTAPRAVFGKEDEIKIGMIQSKLTNNDLKWERKTTTNIGLDMTAFRKRFTMAAEWYTSTSKDLLLSLPILYSTGNEGGSPTVNAGSLRNSGFEIELGWADSIKDFHYAVNVNFSHVKNKVLDLGYGQTVYYNSTSKTEIGKPLGQWYLYKKLGIFQSQEEIDSYVNSDGKIIQPNAKPGDIKYDDYNDDGQITSDDRQICGDPWSKLDMGLNISLGWRGLSLDINGYGRFGQTVYNGARATAGDFANNQNNFNDYIPWTQENHSTTTPRVIYGDTRNSRADQDRWLENGSFFRISDVTIAYSLPRKWLSKIRFEQIRISATLQNLVTFTGYSGLDPEFLDTGVYTLGYDGCSFPNPKGVQFGVSFTF